MNKMKNEKNYILRKAMFKILHRTESYFTVTDLHSNTQSNPCHDQGIFGAGIATSGVAQK